MRSPPRPAPRCLVLALALILGGCETMDDGEAARLFANSQWQARAINGQPVAQGTASTVEFEGATGVGGSTGCNRYRGTVTITADGMQFGPIATTRRACPPPQMTQEQRFTQALRATTGWRLDESDLVLVDTAGNERLRLAPMPPPAAAKLP